jgi:hypothetical protein
LRILHDQENKDSNIQDSRIRIATTVASLKDKIHTDISGNTEAIYWYIRFNIPLDASTVSHKTMGVTDTSGYIMRTDIAYDEEKNRIVISPLDTYEQNRYYLLRISKKVCSKRGQRLKTQINILFKLKSNQISEYKVLKKEVAIPPAKQRPTNYDVLYTRSKVYSADGTEMPATSHDQLPPAELNINIWIGLIGLFMTIGSLYLGNLPLIVVSILVCAGGLAHMFKQLSRNENRSLIFYNRGARKFNKEKYSEAKYLFQRSFMFDDKNEFTEYALHKIEYYL